MVYICNTKSDKHMTTQITTAQLAQLEKSIAFCMQFHPELISAFIADCTNENAQAIIKANMEANELAAQTMKSQVAKYGTKWFDMIPAKA